MSIEFRPESSYGILLLSAEKEDLNGDFMIVTIINGFIEFLFDCGSGKGLIKSSEKINLHQWNSLIIYRYRWDAWIELNEKRRIRGRSSGIFSRITFREFYIIPIYNRSGKSSFLPQAHQFSLVEKEISRQTRCKRKKFILRRVSAVVFVNSLLMDTSTSSRSFQATKLYRLQT